MLQFKKKKKQKDKDDYEVIHQRLKMLRGQRGNDYLNITSNLSFKKFKPADK